MWEDGIRATRLKVLLVRGDSVFSPWEDTGDNRDRWLLLVQKFL